MPEIPNIKTNSIRFSILLKNSQNSTWERYCFFSNCLRCQNKSQKSGQRIHKSSFCIIRFVKNLNDVSHCSAWTAQKTLEIVLLSWRQPHHFITLFNLTPRPTLAEPSCYHTMPWPVYQCAISGLGANVRLSQHETNLLIYCLPLAVLHAHGIGTHK